MTAIPENFGEGGKNMAPSGATGTPTLANTLREIADDLAGIQITTVATPDASDLSTVVTLANALKTAVNAVATAAYTLKTTKA